MGVPLLPVFGRSLISIKTKGGINGIAKRWLKMAAFFFWFFKGKKQFSGKNRTENRYTENRLLPNLFDSDL